MKRSSLAFVFAGLMLHAAAQAAQPFERPEDTGKCQLLRGPVFVAAGSLPLQGCAREIAQRADRYEGSEVRLGFWGQTLIATRANATYRSDNGGTSWKPLNAAFNAATLSPSAIGIPPMNSMPAPRTVAEAPPPTAPIPAQPDPRPSAPSAPVASAPVIAPRPLPPPPARAAAPSAPELASSQRSNCQLRQNADWAVQPQRTLAECLVALDRSAANLGIGEMQRAYWGETYLLIDRKTIYRSADGQDWTRLQDRAGLRQ